MRGKNSIPNRFNWELLLSIIANLILLLSFALFAYVGGSLLIDLVNIIVEPAYQSKYLPYPD